MKITYDNKKPEKDILEQTSRAVLRIVSGKGQKINLFRGIIFLY